MVFQRHPFTTPMLLPGGHLHTSLCMVFLTLIITLDNIKYLRARAVFLTIQPSIKCILIS